MSKIHIGYVTKRTGEKVPFDQERITFAIYKAAASVGGRDLKRASRLSDRVVMMLEDRFGPDDAPGVEVVQDLIEEVLITAGHVQTARSFIVYRESRRAAREQSSGASRAAHGPTPYRVLWETLSWNLSHGCFSLEAINQAIRGGTIDDIITESEKRFDLELDAVAEEIAAKSEQVKLVIVGGPSSSGKTTTTHRLSQRLAAKGLNLAAINVDNYFRDLEFQPRDGGGDYDYETPEAIDLPLFNEHLEALLAGRRIESPQFDFHTGRRLAETLPLKLKKGEIALIDTLHGFYKGLTAKIPEEQKYKVYIEALVQVMDDEGEWVKWTDLRLLRRMTRDRIQRNVTPFQTLDHWHYVRRSEKKHIIPYLGDADFVLNGSLPFEIALYKPILQQHFLDYIRRDGNAADGNERARRVYQILEQVEPLDDRQSIPPHSIVREFVGGG